VDWAYFPTAFFYSGSLELVPRYCNNLYLDSVLFEVRNVFTSLLGLVTVSHLSPKGWDASGGIRTIGLAVGRSPELKTCLKRKYLLPQEKPSPPPILTDPSFPIPDGRLFGH
jgi:hypothetical protein